MLHDLRQTLRPAVSLLLFFTLLTGLAYPLAVTGAAQALMPWRANGSLVTSSGATRGSRLIGQRFASARYFHGRPSAVSYDAGNSGGSNLSPGSAALDAEARQALAQVRADGGSGAVPADLVTASASGLDPDISPAAAMLQIPRVTRARGLPEAQVSALVERATREPLLGVLGEPRVNVLELNLALDGISARKTP